MLDKFYTAGEVADFLSVDVDKVLGWIRAGEIEAVNAATDASSIKPQWRIGAQSMVSFLSSRTSKNTKKKRIRIPPSPKDSEPAYLN